jgi:tetratricopeptide (TPR) repeat protein
MRALLGAALCLTVVVPAAAQDRRWVEAYRQGRDAVNLGRYDDGIRLLDQAVRAEPRQERARRIEGAGAIDYFPYYYLGLAYLRTGQYDKAETAFKESRVCKCLTTDLAKLQAVWETDAAKRRGAAPAGPPPRGAAPAGPPPVDDRAYVAQLLQQANQFLAAGNLSGARARFQEAETRSAGAGRLGLDQIRQRQAEYARLTASALAESRAGRLDAAIEQLKQAQAADREQFVADGHASRMQAWLQLVESKGATKSGSVLERARSAAAAHRYADAATLYRSLLDTKDQAEAKAWLDVHTRFVDLRDRARKLTDDGQFDLARQALDDARRQSEERFKAERLDELLAAIDKKAGVLPEDHAAPLRAALVAYLQGDASRARALLEPIAAGGAAVDARVRVPALAYLGAAYADLSFAARGDAERTDLRSKAVERFKELLTLQPGYQLSESLVSPRVREILEQVRVKR